MPLVVVVLVAPVVPEVARLVAREQVRTPVVKLQQTTPVAVVVETLPSATQPLWVAMEAPVLLSSRMVHS